MSEIRNIVFGIDGAHFELIELWIEAEKLSHIGRVIDTGVTSNL